MDKRIDDTAPHCDPTPPQDPPFSEVPTTYPGCGLPLTWQPGVKHAQGHDPEDVSLDMLSVLEIAMMQIMDRLTDKPDWHKKVFDQEIVKKWHDEAFDQRTESAIHGEIVANKEESVRRKPKQLMTEAAFEYLIRELRQKAKLYEEKRLTPTLDAMHAVAKSDELVDGDLQAALRETLLKLKADQGSTLDWHPGSDEKVLDLLHPSLFPLVYGRTRAIDAINAKVSIEDAISKWAGKGEPLDHTNTAFPKASRTVAQYSESYGDSSFSRNYQWLPSDVSLSSDGAARLTSYVNNLHPKSYATTYRLINRLITAALPLWDQVLKVDDVTLRGPGRLRSRFLKASAPWDESDDSCWVPKMPHEAREKYDDGDSEDPIFQVWQNTRDPLPLVPEGKPEELDYGVKSSLVDRFQKTGLQVIVKMASIELTPEKPEFPAGSWHIEGQLNEHICATALYYVDCDNITPSRLSFRQPTSYETSTEYEYGQDNFEYLELTYGTGLRDDPCIQNLGSVETRQGRLLAFPNFLQHRVEGFRLKDPTKPGHRRFVALWLVDPYIRIISTAIVPPQQQSWWLEAAFHGQFANNPSLQSQLYQILDECGGDVSIEQLEKAKQNSRLPPELDAIISKYARREDLPMSLAEAKEHRLALMAERTAFKDEVNEQMLQHTYNFCEH